MFSNLLPKIISAGIVTAAAVVLWLCAPSVPAQTPASPDASPQLDYGFFKTRVEPIFLKSDRTTTPAATFVTK